MAPNQEENWEINVKETVKWLRSQVNQVEEYNLLRKNRSKHYEWKELSTEPAPTVVPLPAAVEGRLRRIS